MERGKRVRLQLSCNVVGTHFDQKMSVAVWTGFVTEPTQHQTTWLAKTSTCLKVFGLLEALEYR